jgi:hypothetical protein
MVPLAHEAIIAKGDQNARQILIQKDPKSADNTLSDLTEKELVAKPTLHWKSWTWTP